MKLLLTYVRRSGQLVLIVTCHSHLTIQEFPPPIGILAIQYLVQLPGAGRPVPVLFMQYCQFMMKQALFCITESAEASVGDSDSDSVCGVAYTHARELHPKMCFKLEKCGVFGNGIVSYYNAYLHTYVRIQIQAWSVHPHGTSMSKMCAQLTESALSVLQHWPPYEVKIW